MRVRKTDYTLVFFVCRRSERKMWGMGDFVEVEREIMFCVLKEW